MHKAIQQGLDLDVSDYKEHSLFQCYFPTLFLIVILDSWLSRKLLPRGKGLQETLEGKRDYELLYFRPEYTLENYLDKILRRNRKWSQDQFWVTQLINSRSRISFSPYKGNMSSWVDEKVVSPSLILGIFFHLIFFTTFPSSPEIE